MELKQRRRRRQRERQKRNRFRLEKPTALQVHHAFVYISLRAMCDLTKSYHKSYMKFAWEH